MKKIYMTPMMETMEIKPVVLLTGSNAITGNEGFDIPFGGLDDGTLPPGARELQNTLGLPGFVFE
jgi:hypothetical protein